MYRVVVKFFLVKRRPSTCFHRCLATLESELAFERFASSSTLIKFQREEMGFYLFDLTRILNNRDNFNSRSLVEKRNVLNNREINPETILMGKSKISCRRG